MSDIDHKAEAAFCIEVAWNEDTHERSVNRMTQAQVHATLALVEQQAAAVEQQRVANLIAAAAMIQLSKQDCGQAGLDGWCVDSEDEIHGALADPSTWIALLGSKDAKKRGLA